MPDSSDAVCVLDSFASTLVSRPEGDRQHARNDQHAKSAANPLGRMKRALHPLITLPPTSKASASDVAAPSA